jgi:hypothetical protein
LYDVLQSRGPDGSSIILHNPFVTVAVFSVSS